MVASVPPPALGLTEVTRIADLHRRELPTSILAALGQKTLERYYRWVLSSDSEALFVSERDAGIRGVAVLSAEPTSLIGRFVRSAPLTFAAEVTLALGRSRLFRKQVLAFARECLRPNDSVEQHFPELMQIFVDSECRGRALGSSLLQQVEARLEQQAVAAYCVRTLVEENEATLGFYNKRGFAAFDQRDFCGERYVFLRKPLVTN